MMVWPHHHQQFDVCVKPPQARDEASMRPSVARKLNEKIRGLEGELEQLRTNKKVKDLEKKVQVRAGHQLFVMFVSCSSRISSSRSRASQ
jgi:hypothetical protein